MLVTTLLFTGIAIFVGLNPIATIIVGISLSLSSTTFVLFYLKDSSQLTLSYGQTSLSILLFQDIIIVPVLALIPFFSSYSHSGEVINFSSLALKIIILCGLVIIFLLF